MRKINLIVVHCSDSDVPSHDNIDTIRGWHTLPKMPKDVAEGIKNGKLQKSEAYKYGNGWSDVGYHFFIAKTGDVFHGRSEHTVGAHVAGFNSRSIGICLSGRNGFTSNQFLALGVLVKDLCEKYDIEKKDVLAHHDLQPAKTCPNFDLHKLMSSWNWH